MSKDPTPISLPDKSERYIPRLQERVATLEKDNKAQEEYIDKLEDQRNEFSRDCNALRGELTKAQDRVVVLEVDNRVLDEKLKLAEGLTVCQEEAAVALREHIGVLEKDNRTLEVDRDGLAEQIVMMEKSHNARVETDVLRFVDKGRLVFSETYDHDMGELRQKLAVAEGRGDGFKARSEGLEEEIRRLGLQLVENDTMGSLRATIARISAEFNDMRRQRDEWRENAENALQKLGEVRVVNDENAELYAATNDETARVRASRDELRRKTQADSTSIRTLRSERDKAAVERDKQEVVTADLNAEVEAANHLLEARSEQIADLEAQIETQRETLAMADRIDKDLRERQNMAERDRDSLMRQRDRQDDEIAELRYSFETFADMHGKMTMLLTESLPARKHNKFDPEPVSHGPKIMPDPKGIGRINRSPDGA